MAVLNMTNAQEALKLFYLDGLRYQLNTSNPILAIMERDTESVEGEKIVMALRYGRQGGVGNRADDGTLPTPNSRKTKQASWVTKNIFARIQISDKTIKASRSRAGAFVSLLEADLEDAQNDAKDSLARQMFGDGTGKLATITAASHASTTLTLTVDSTQYFVEGQWVDIIDNSGGDVVLTNGEKLEVIFVDEDNNQIGLHTSNDISGNIETGKDFLVVNGNLGMELTGFGAVFTPNNTLYGINRSVNKWFNPTVDDLTDSNGDPGEISEVAIQKNIDNVDRVAGGKTNILVSSYGVRRAYQDLLLATKRTTNVMQLKGGFTAIEYNGMPFTVEKYCPKGTLFGLDMTTWRLYHMGDWDWLDFDGAILSRVSDKAVWEATLARYCDLGCSKPRGNFKMYGIEEH